jgi:anti-sigma factor RsiW
MAGVEAMNHSEAVEQMAVERYLLGELPPELRDAFEEHVFDCQECSLDLRAEAAFLEEAKAQLPELATRQRPAGIAERPGNGKKKQWFSWFSPVFAVPAYALLLLIIGYQNFATIPSLRTAAARPEILPWSSVHIGTRDAAPVPVAADRNQGVVLLVDLPQQAGSVSYAFELDDAQGKSVWKTTVSAPTESQSGTLSLFIPGRGLEPGAYTLAISGVLASGQSTETRRRTLQVNFNN